MPIKSSSIGLIRQPELLPTTLDEHDPYYRCMEDVQQRCAGIGWYTVRLEPSPRLLVATASRKKCMDSATRGMGEAECVVLFLESEIKKCHATKCPVSVWFDQMSTVTYTAVKYSGWIEVHVNSKCSLNGKDALHNVLKALADTWRYLLCHSDGELGIDSEFTRPAILSLLEHFTHAIRAAGCAYKFDWKPVSASGIRAQQSSDKRSSLRKMPASY